MPDDKGYTLRKRLEHLQKQHGVVDSRLKPVALPEGFEYLWVIYWELRGGATEGMSGTRISWADIADYEKVTGIKLDAFEVDCIRQMEGAWQKKES